MKREQRLVISGMSCHHCVEAVRRELAKIPKLEVKDVAVGAAVVSYDDAAVPSSRIEEAVREAGYALEQ